MCCINTRAECGASRAKCVQSCGKRNLLKLGRTDRRGNTWLPEWQPRGTSLPRQFVPRYRGCTKRRTLELEYLQSIVHLTTHSTTHISQRQCCCPFKLSESWTRSGQWANLQRHELRCMNVAFSFFSFWFDRNQREILTGTPLRSGVRKFLLTNRSKRSAARSMHSSPLPSSRCPNANC